MGKGFELLGMLAFQIFLGITIVTTLLPGSKEELPTTLTDSNIRAFLSDFIDITSGEREDIDQYGITEYLMEHLEEGGIYSTAVTYNVDGMPPQEETKTLDRINYVSHILQNMEKLPSHETSLHIDTVHIEKDGKNGLAVLRIEERAIMPVPQPDGEKAMIPVSGTSYCEQEIKLNDEQVIVLHASSCTTDIGFLNSDY